MKLYLDTTDVCDVSKYINTGLIDGVTTNFTHLLMTGRRPHDIYNELKMMGVKDIHMEIVGETPFIVGEAMASHEFFNFSWCSNSFSQSTKSYRLGHLLLLCYGGV